MTGKLPDAQAGCENPANRKRNSGIGGIPEGQSAASQKKWTNRKSSFERPADRNSDDSLWGLKAILHHFNVILTQFPDTGM